MEYYIAAFRSRSQTMRFYESLRGSRIECGVISTPREAMAGCGISVRFKPADYANARRVLAMSGLCSFIGFFRISPGGRGYSAERL